MQPALREAAPGVGEQRGAAPHTPTRSSAQRSSRCEPPCSASSPTWTHAHCCMPPRSAGTGASWPAIPPSGHGCCSRTPVSVPRCLSLPAALAVPLSPAVNSPSHSQRLAPPGVVFATLTIPQLLLGPLKCSQEASCPTAGPPPASHTQPLAPGNPSLPAVPGNAGSVVHPGPLADTAEPETPAAGQEGEQGGVCPEHPVRPRGVVGWAGGAPGEASQKRRWPQAAP